MDLNEQFQQFLKERDIVAPATGVLLAVSGGLDSMVMLHLFRASGLSVGIAHCNFQLRGAESDGDEQFVQSLAADWNIPFFVKRFDTKSFSEAQGISTQMAARELRYAWFSETAQGNHYQFVATAHNLNDSVETALLNFIRGTGLSGMLGMRNAECGVRNEQPGLENMAIDADPTDDELLLRIPHSTLRTQNSLDINSKSTDNEPLLRTPHSEFRTQNSEFRTPILRPLLFASRDAIREYAELHNIGWREDSSNAGDDYARNFLRHQILPKMQEINPNFLNTAARNLARLGETKDNLDFLTRQFLGSEQNNSVQNDDYWTIDKSKLAQFPAPRRVLHDLLKTQGFTEEQCRQLAENLDKVGFEIESNSGWQVLVDRVVLMIRYLAAHKTSGEGVSAEQKQQDALKIEAGDLMLRLPDNSSLFFMETDPAQPFPAGEKTVLIAADKIQFPLMLRHWVEGDAFQPLGMQGQTQKLQDFFTNRKLSRIDKEQVWLLFNGNGALIWVLGLRLDDRFKITGSSSKALKVVWS